MPLYAIGHCNSDTEMFRPVPRVVVALVALALAEQLSAEEHGQSRSHTLPLSDLANRGNWSVYEPMTDEFSGDTLNPAKWFSHSRQYIYPLDIDNACSTRAPLTPFFPPLHSPFPISQARRISPFLFTLPCTLWTCYTTMREKFHCSLLTAHCGYIALP